MNKNTIRAFGILGSLVVASLALAGCSSTTDGSSSTAPSAAYAGAMTFQSGSLVLSCQGAPPMTMDLTKEQGGMPGHFTNTVTGDTTFHHKDANDCQFDFTISGGSASIAQQTCSSVPDGKGGTTTLVFEKMTFTPTADGKGLTVDGNGTYAGCKMTIDGVADRS